MDHGKINDKNNSVQKTCSSTVQNITKALVVCGISCLAYLNLAAIEIWGVYMNYDDEERRMEEGVKV